jgi:integrase
VLPGLALLLQLALVRPRSEEFKELEIVVLRHELAVLRRQLRRSEFSSADRLFLAAASRLLRRSRSRSFAVESANETLAVREIQQIGAVSPHGLRRTFASLRCAVGDDVAYTAAQLGHTDAVFTLRGRFTMRRRDDASKRSRSRG